MAKDGVFVEDFVKLAKFEADDFVVMQAFKVPVLLHNRWKSAKFIRRNV